MQGEELVFMVDLSEVNSLVERFGGRLPVGSHFVTFHSLLPLEIPFSFENKLGTIRSAFNTSRAYRGFNA